MEIIQKLEKKIASGYKSVPNLPVSGRKWLAENVWWLAVISVILSAISILVSLIAVISFMTWTGSLDAYSGYYSTSPYASGWIIGAIITLVFTVAITILTASAISHLRVQRSRGWMLLFVVYLLSVVEVFANAILTYSVAGFIGGILFGAIGLAISGYFLFQIRSYFGAGIKVTRSASAKK